MDVGNLISGSSAFSKSSLNIWKFTVHVLLKPGLENFEHYFASMWDECNYAVVWTFFGIASLGLERKLTFSSPVVTAEFSKFAGILSAALSQHHLSGFEIAQLVLSSPLALFVVMVIWLHTPGWLGQDEWSHHHGYPGHEDVLNITLLCILATSS